MPARHRPAVNERPYRLVNAISQAQAMSEMGRDAAARTAFMPWDASYRLNVREPDGQHRMIVTLLNQLYRALKFGRSDEDLAQLFDEFVEYAKYHFSAEERLMHHSRFPDYLLHRAVHEDMKARLADLREQMDHGRHAVLSVVTLQFLRDWFAAHMAVTDDAVGRHLNSLRTSSSPHAGRAWIH